MWLLSMILAAHRHRRSCSRRASGAADLPAARRAASRSGCSGSSTTERSRRRVTHRPRSATRYVGAHATRRAARRYVVCRRRDRCAPDGAQTLMSDAGRRRRLEVRDQAGALRRAARPGDQRPRDADLPDHLVRLQQRRARAEPLRARRVRQHLHAHQEPDQAVVEERVAALEGGTAALAVASGQAAETFAVLNIARRGDHIVSSSSIYGGTYNLFKYTLAKLGIETTFVENQDDAEEWRRAVRPNTKLFFAETIGNPKINILDIALVAGVAHENGLPLIVDNTIATPVPHPPVRARRRHRRALGHEVPRRPRHGHRRHHRRRRHVRVVEERREVPRPHRARPVLPRRELHRRGRRRPRLHHQGPRAAAARPRCRDRAGERVALIQGIETLSLRIERHVQNAQEIAEWLENHPDVASVNYSGLPSSPWYAAANKYAPKGVGAVLSFELKGGVEAGRALVDNLDAVQPPRQHRRRALARHPPGIHDALAAHPRAAAHHRCHARPRAPLGRHRERRRPQGRPRGRLRAPRRKVARGEREGVAHRGVTTRSRSARRSGDTGQRWTGRPRRTPSSRASSPRPTRRPLAGKPPATGAWREGDPVGDRQFARSAPCVLERGGELPSARLAYETWGELNRRRATTPSSSLHALTGDSHVVGHRRPGPSDRRLVGRHRRPGHAASTPTSWFVVAPNMLGGCQGTTGPASHAPDGTEWGSRFPFLTIRDQVDAQVASPTPSASTAGRRSSAARWAGCTRSSGPSRRPDRVERLAVLAAPRAVHRRPDRRSTRCSSRRVRIDPHFHGGDYYDARRGAAPRARPRAPDGAAQLPLAHRAQRPLRAQLAERDQPARRRRPLRRRVLPRLPRQQVHPPLRREQLPHASSRR